MKVSSFRSLALASLTSLAMATSSSAVTILNFGQAGGEGLVIATAAAGTTTLTTNSVAGPGSVRVSITNIGGVELVPAPGPNQIIQAFETFTNVVSSGPATQVGNDIRQAYNGTISFTSLPGGAGFNYLTATFTNAVLFSTAGAGSATFQGSDPPVSNVVYTSQDARVLAALALLGPEAARLDNFGIGFSGIVQPPGFGITGSGANATVANFTAQNGGTFSSTTPIPEPSGLVMAGTAMLASLGCIGWRRRQSSRA